MIQKGRAFAPGHVTGFFEIFNTQGDTLRRGSRGAGFCTSLGVETVVEALPSDRTRVMVLDGVTGNEIEAKTTVRAVNALLESAHVGCFEVKLHQESQLPVGQGCGMSGASALSAVLALSSALETGIEREDVVGIAHSAEVLERTGLGDVVAQAIGGFEIRVKEGGPKHGHIISKSLDYKIVLCCFGDPLSTKGILDDTDLTKRINEVGRRSLEKVLSIPEETLSIWDFISISHEFATQAGLLTRNMAEALRQVEDLGMGSMAMLGNTVFVVPREPSMAQELHHRLSQMGVVFPTMIESRPASSC